MLLLSTLIVIVIVMALLFDFVNGWNDSANAIATVVATRVMSPFVAVVVAAVLNLGGALVGNKVAETVSKIIYVDPDPKHLPPDVEPEDIPSQEGVLIIVIAGLTSAAIWAAWMTLLGMPISGSHSLLGGIVGAGVAAGGTKILVAGTIQKTLLFMLIAPALGFIVAYLFYVALIWVTVTWRPSTMNRSFGKLQILSACGMAFTHGTNDAQKVMGIITMALVAGGWQTPSADGKFHVQLWVQLACALAISVGTAAGGWKVIKTLGHHLTKLGPPEGFAAETSAALVLTVTANMGVPVSTTHTITGSVLGLGATRGMSSVRWGLGEKIILAWVFTLPATIAMGGSLDWLFSLFLSP
ncbi:MAG TPA: inorganic phosphate transporter [Planctomycetaceae bacterium]|nr:inorganic phosphate transporter [Planctomycetaceae bacterium]